MLHRKPYQVSEKYECYKNNYLVSTDREKLDVQAIHQYLTRSTWAKGIHLDIVSASIENSLNFGLYHNEHQIGFARLITDYAIFPALCPDVLQGYRHRKGRRR